jgi:hypothetical protein
LRVHGSGSKVKRSGCRADLEQHVAVRAVHDVERGAMTHVHREVVPRRRGELRAGGVGLQATERRMWSTATASKP